MQLDSGLAKQQGSIGTLRLGSPRPAGARMGRELNDTGPTQQQLATQATCRQQHADITLVADRRQVLGATAGHKVDPTPSPHHPSTCCDSNTTSGTLLRNLRKGGGGHG